LDCQHQRAFADGAPFEGEVDGHEVKLLNAKQLSGGEILDLTEDIPPNYDFFSEGPATTPWINLNQCRPSALVVGLSSKKPN
jgi:hypothetical protein